MKHSSRHRGFTLVELMIALVIGLFLVGGLLTLVQAMKRTSVSQSGMSQLQENERMAMQLLTDVIQSTGYFPLTALTLNNTAQSIFTVTGPFTVAGQSIVGTGAANAAAPGNVITVRYQSSGTDNVINCNGGTTAAANTMFVNQFSVDNKGNLSCLLTVGGVVQPAMPLISGLTNMQILYGVQTNTGVSTSSVDTYLDAPGVTAGPYWTAVKSVKVTLTFLNPMYGTLAGQTQVGIPATVPFTRIIPVMIQ